MDRCQFDSTVKLMMLLSIMEMIDVGSVSR